MVESTNHSAVSDVVTEYDWALGEMYDRLSRYVTRGKYDEDEIYMALQRVDASGEVADGWKDWCNE